LPFGLAVLSLSLACIYGSSLLVLKILGLLTRGLRKLTMIGKVSLYIYMFLTTMELTTVIGSRSVIYYAS
jgi:hypothetical protein